MARLCLKLVCMHTGTVGLQSECGILVVRRQRQEGHHKLNAILAAVAVVTHGVLGELTVLAMTLFQDKCNRCECPLGVDVLFISKGAGAQCALHQ